MPGLPSPPGSKGAPLSLGLTVNRGLVKNKDFHYHPVVMRLHLLWSSSRSGGEQEQGTPSQGEISRGLVEPELPLHPAVRRSPSTLKCQWRPSGETRLPYYDNNEVVPYPLPWPEQGQKMSPKIGLNKIQSSTA